MGVTAASSAIAATAEAWSRPAPVLSATTAPSPPTGGYRPEPAYHPQLAGLTPTGGGYGPPTPYALPPGSTLSETAGGTQAQPFDVTLSQLATAVYGTRGDPPQGWNAVTDQDLRERGIADPQAWREQFLGGGEQTREQEFKAEIYTDGSGNFVLSYRGTEGSAADWKNNFAQALGFQTDPVDKFSGTAANTAMEFARVFGDQDTNPTNLAITGHSQGGGLAAVGSLATGVPAVTFDASGIHPNTLERMGFTPDQAREFAENGGIRAYSLDSDPVSQAQESWVSGLLAPDALGTRIVVSPGPIAEHTLFGRGAAVEFGNLSPLERAALNAAVEAARHSGIPLVDQVGDLAYSAMSHNPNLLTAAMIERQPWQPGYENPSDLGRTLQDLLPDPLKDDFAINTHDFAADVIDVANTDFRDGDFVQGGLRIFGDLGEGVYNSAGDVVNRGAESVAGFVDDHVGGLPGDLLAGAINGLGNAGEAALDRAGQRFEQWADDAGAIADDFVGWLSRR